KEAAVAKVTPKAYKNILNYYKNAEQLERICNNCGITSLKDRYGSNLDSSKVEKYKKKIATYLKKKIQSTEKKAVVEQPKVAEKPAKVKESEPVVKPIHKPVVVSQPKEEKKSTATDDSKKKIEEKINKLSKQEIEKKLTEPPKEYGYNTIIQNLVKDLEPKKYDGVGYEIYNLKVKDNFKKEINTGNYLYNIAHVVPAIVKLPFIGIQKIANRFLYRKSAIDRMSTIKQRLEALPEKDLEILLKEYKNHVETEKYGSGLNILINERLEKYTNDKVEKINKQIEKNYEDLFDTMNKVQLADSKARDKSLSDDERYEYILMKKALLKGKAQQVKSVRDDYNTAKDLISNGMDGFTKAAKDSALKNSYVGYFFTRERKLDTELLDREAALERAEMTAIARDDDEMALRVFVEHEKLLCKNTMIKNSIFGKRSVGKKYYQPLAEKLEGVRVPFSKKKKVTYGNSAIDTVEKYSEIQKKFIR
ncbi:MAG: hypothetical protein IJ193_02915, partial [Bacilli bacterium]|nr:hypothetical protein [Bacilli bacterium]